jgi:hypothetical protein
VSSGDPELDEIAAKISAELSFGVPKIKSAKKKKKSAIIETPAESV